MSLFKTFKNGIIDENPTIKLVLGMCPTLAVTTSAINGVGMGLSTTAVLIGSNVVISLLRKLIPEKVRIPAFITVIAGFVTIVQMLLKAYVPAIDKALGIFIPLIVVNCIILARAESFASKNGPAASAVDGIGMGLGFTIALVAIGSVREILGNGSIFGIKLFAGAVSPALVMILPPGGFLVFGLIMGAVNKATGKKITMSGCAGCGGQCKKISSGIGG
ncbi:MAG: electron transport complex subunit E [Clostridia bacterium]|nr:electron transport complex subunit E [Clostridia bacterium]